MLSVVLALTRAGFIGGGFDSHDVGGYDLGGGHGFEGGHQFVAAHDFEGGHEMGGGESYGHGHEDYHVNIILYCFHDLKW